ncbi:hypothetical protein ACFQZE_07180 [Paenibacillus sp. GCM10027627]|uniref:hypothetical protein n=1 Tax=unclassified Paenibacillus TaxID=185978 RepID=UPI00362A8EF0
MKIEIMQDKSTFGKQKSYIASFTVFSASGSTKEQAKENLLNILQWSKENASHPQAEIRQLPEVNRTIILLRSDIGYTVIVSHHDESNDNVSVYGYIGHSEALRRLEQHIQNYAE